MTHIYTEALVCCSHRRAFCSIFFLLCTLTMCVSCSLLACSMLSHVYIRHEPFLSRAPKTFYSAFSARTIYTVDNLRCVNIFFLIYKKYFSQLLEEENEIKKFYIAKKKKLLRSVRVKNNPRRGIKIKTREIIKRRVKFGNFVEPNRVRFLPGYMIK